MSPNPCDVSALQQVSKIFCGMCYVLRNKPKSIKIIAEAFSESVSRWIFAFDNVFNNKNADKIKKVKKRKNVYYVYSGGGGDGAGVAGYGTSSAWYRGLPHSQSAAVRRRLCVREAATYDYAKTR